MIPATFRLRVSRFDAICQFELTWGQNQCITARLNYSGVLDALYQDWQQAYLNFYQSKQQIPDPSATEPSPMRARVVNSGSVTPNIDWQSRLIDAEIALLREFQDWLWQGELRDISKAIAAASRQLGESSEQKIDVFLTCDPIDLARLPWETWEITDDLAATGKIRIVRSPSNIRAEAGKPGQTRWKRARILAICCDDVGLNLSKEKQILKSLEPLVYVKPVGWSTNTHQTIEQVREEIVNAITDTQGWDILFFAGHSDETQMTGGKLAIAPNTSLTIEELKPYLTIAKNRGLQLAMFNSCSGLQIAESLIDLGLNEVVVMRERIHNQVAQEFLVQFARSLACYKDVHQSVQDATQLLLNKRIQYPSAHLVPSVFRRLGTSSLKLIPPDWRQWLGALLPKKRYELIAVSLLSIISLLPSVQLGLLDQRLLTQAWYRQFTHQFTYQYEVERPAELALIRIDDESIKRDRYEIGRPHPMSHRYISQLIESLVASGVKVIGIDYLLDLPDQNSDVLAATIKQATDQGTRFVFVKTPSNHGEWLQTPEQIADPRNVHANGVRSQGDDFHMPLQVASLETALPLSYWLSWLHQICIQTQTDTCNQSSIAEQQTLATRYAKRHLPQLYQSSLSAAAYGLAGQLWLHPITDFSIPPQAVYRDIPAWELLYQKDAPELSYLPQQTALITAGGYEYAGLTPGDGIENFAPPAAMLHWYLQAGAKNPYRKMTAGEHLGYLFHHFLYQRFVTPVPDLWMIWVAVIVAKVMLSWLQKGSSNTFINQGLQPFQSLSLRQSSKLLFLIIGTLIYVLLSLQIYISFAVLFPIILPTAMFWAYALPVTLKKPQQHL